MAIIRLDCNLNGGDSVTPNNELFYRIYGDVDAYATPIHETGTALSDANVTVDNDSVIITGVDGATNTEFKIAAVDGASNEGILSDAVGGSIILFEDDFAGTTIDTAKWIVNNSNANYVLTQNDGLVAAGDGLVAGAVGDVSLRGQSSITAMPLYISFDLKFNTDQDIGFAAVGVTGDIDPAANANLTYIRPTTTSASDELASTLRVSSTNNNQTLQVDCRTTAQTFKISITSTTVDWHHWDGSAWVSVAPQQSETALSAYYPLVMGHSTSGDVINVDIYNYVITDADFSTQRP